MESKQGQDKIFKLDDLGIDFGDHCGSGEDVINYLDKKLGWEPLVFDGKQVGVYTEGEAIKVLADYLTENGIRYKKATYHIYRGGKGIAAARAAMKAWMHDALKIWQGKESTQ